MALYFHKTPKGLQKLIPNAIFSIPNNDHKIYLTFDDGPEPEITSVALDLLKEHNAKATFFCLGKQAEKHPKLLERISSEGHQIGNHSYSHLYGWKSENEAYLKDVKKAESFTSDNLFRPPYGKAKRSQLKELQQQYNIILWDVLPGDFDDKKTFEECIDATIKNTTSGSIIVLHDNKKCGKKMLEVLKEILPALTNKGFIFEALSFH